MLASHLIGQAVSIIAMNSSPYREELLTQLQHLVFASMMHERCVESKTIPPRETALGHKPKGVTVAGHSVQTDAALAALECGD